MDIALISHRLALGKSRHEFSALERARDAAISDNARLEEENKKMKYRIKHLVRALRKENEKDCQSSGVASAQEQSGESEIVSGNVEG